MVTMHQQAPGQQPPVFADTSNGALPHVLGLLFGFLGPLALLVFNSNRTPFADYNTREALNFHLTIAGMWFVTAIFSVVLIGFLFMPIVLALQFILPIVAASNASSGRTYRYPVTIRIV